MLYGVSVIEQSKFRQNRDSSGYYGFTHNCNISDCSEEDNEEAVTGSSNGSSGTDEGNSIAVAPIYLQCPTRH